MKIITGGAGSGKTTAILHEIDELAKGGVTGILLIVPEQNSHSFERRILEYAGNRIASHAEVLSFGRLADRVLEGRQFRNALDDGGRMLCLHKAFGYVENSLTVLRGAGSPNMLGHVLGVIDEMKTYCITPEALGGAAENAAPETKKKLTDLALIYAAYENRIHGGNADPADKLTRLAESLESGEYGAGRKVFIDGFTGFTAQEYAVIRELLHSGANLTVSVSCGSPDDRESMHYAQGRESVGRLKRMADEAGVKCDFIHLDKDLRHREHSAMSYLTNSIFSYSAEKFTGENGEVFTYRAATPNDECRFAACEILRLVRENGYRYREIAVLCGDFESYRSTIRAEFDRFGVPVYMDDKTELLASPPVVMLLAALEAVCTGFRTEAVVRFVKCPLAGLSALEADIFENYVTRWEIRGEKAFIGEREFYLPPDGFGMENEGKKLLHILNRIRIRIARRLRPLADALHEKKTAAEFGVAVDEFLEGLNFEIVAEKEASRLEESGERKQADEYRQVSDIMTAAVTQCSEVLGDEEMDLKTFADFLHLVLSQYRVGTIPAALDRVAVGDLGRSASREIRVAFVIGATDTSIPPILGQTSMIDDREREFLLGEGIEIAPSASKRMANEMGKVFNAITSPAERLYFSFPANDGENEEKRASFVFERVERLIPNSTVKIELPPMLAAEKPMFSEACAAMGGEVGETEEAAYRVLNEFTEYAERLEKIHKTINDGRAPISDTALVDKLYGKKIRMSASKVDKFASCKFRFFMEYGMGAKPEKKYKMDAPEVGSFIHYVLENTCREVGENGGFSALPTEDIRKISEKYVDTFIQNTLPDWEDRSPRFRYLFRRLRRSVAEMVENIAGELAVSDFKPMDFELDFSNHGDLPAVTIPLDRTEMEIVGKVDRVDGWINDGKLYLRVIDYKTGKKIFDLRDIFNGMNLQMLIYLFALESFGDQKYHMPIKPAGVLYFPARYPLIKVEDDLPDDEYRERMYGELKRSGLIVGDDGIVTAMEHPTIDYVNRFIPIKLNKNGSISDRNDSLVSAEQMGRLHRKVDDILIEMGNEIASGKIDTDPQNEGENTTCRYCPYHAACLFDETNGHDQYRKKTKRSIKEIQDYLRGDDGNGQNVDG